MTKKKLILISLFILFAIRIIFAFLTWHGDVWNHMDWGERFFEYGAAKFYAPQTNIWSFLWPNQPPGTTYMFAGIFKLFKFVFSIFWWINIKIPLFPSGIITYFESNLYPALLKLPAILSDFGIAYLIYKIIRKVRVGKKSVEKLAAYGAIIFLINPVVWYNSSVWGQYDSVINFLTLAAFYFLLDRKILLATTFYALSIYTKATLLVFAPIFFVIWAKQKYSVKEYLLSIIFPLLLIGVLTYPFSQSEPFSWLYNLYKDKIFTEQRQVVTSNAFNIWAGLTGIHQIPHDKLLGLLSYKLWGLIMFSVSFLLPLRLILKKQDTKMVIWVLAIISVSSFSLLTNMHERYLFSFFPLLTILVILERRLILFYVLISALNFLNLYNFWWTPEINFVKQFLSYNGGYFGRVLGYFEFALYIFFYGFFVKTQVLAKRKV